MLFSEERDSPSTESRLVERIFKLEGEKGPGKKGEKGRNGLRENPSPPELRLKPLI